MAMNDLRMFVGLEHELQRRPAKKGESFPIIMVAVKHAAVEEIAVQVRFDKETLEAIHPAEVNVAMDPVLIKGHPKIAVALGQTPNAVVAHAIVLGQDNLDGVAANLQFLGQAMDH